MKRFTLFFLGLFMSCLSLVAEERYKLVDFGILGNEFSEVTDINNQGQVCGVLYDSTKGDYLFIWDPQTGLKTVAVSTTEGTPHLNDLGLIVGGYWKKGYFLTEESLFQWKASFSQIEDIGLPSGVRGNSVSQGCSILVGGVNNKGQVLIAEKPNFNDDFYESGLKEACRTWIYEEGAFAQIDNPILQLGYKINNKSHILGATLKKKEASHVFVPILFDMEKKTALNLPFSTSAVGIGLNDQDQVIGFFQNGSTGAIQGFVWDVKKKLTRLGNFVPFSINNKGQMVGEYWTGKEEGALLLYEKGKQKKIFSVVDLTDDQKKGWKSFDEVVKINDRGWIIGNGKFKGGDHGFLLMPYSE